MNHGKNYRMNQISHCLHSSSVLTRKKNIAEAVPSCPGYDIQCVPYSFSPNGGEKETENDVWREATRPEKKYGCLA